MALTEAFSTGFGTSDPLDREVAEMQWRIDRARRNPWLGGDVLAPEFRSALAAFMAPRAERLGARLEPGPVWQGHRNRWREVVRPVR
ncbi:hypothetical protein [Rhabdothermincola sediminis]|uniref:hypothetical protein n=1 Tax=Rhabdothermincola sediminis TaxID=2751370 RepID=UPI001AA04186|nr:hypothetical protein [Rhabdothermincola sediminis]